MPDQPKAILFGSIGTLVETSELQRDSFNGAFRDAGLDWEWGREDYREMLKHPGGRARIADFAKARGEDVDVDAVYAAKVAHFRARAEAGLELRLGVPEVIEAAQASGVTLGFATGTGRETVDLVFDGLDGVLSRNVFDFIGDGAMIKHAKPAPDIYRHALFALDLEAGDALAIEDTPESAKAALAAGIACLGFPGEEARGRVFPPQMTHLVDRLEPFLLDLGDR